MSPSGTLAWITPIDPNRPNQPPVIGGGPIYPGGPTDPGYGQGHPFPPHPGGGPIHPGQPPTIGGGPILPGQPPGIWPPTVGGGPMPPPPTIGGGPIVPELPGVPIQPLPPGGNGGTAPVVSHGKPAGVSVLPADPTLTPPTAPPQPPGVWVTIDPGHGQPPAWGFVPKGSGAGTPPDTGLPPVAGHPLPTPPGGPPTVTPAGGAPAPTPTGHWVPLATASPKSATTWAWVPEIGPQYGLTPPASGPK